MESRTLQGNNDKLLTYEVETRNYFLGLIYEPPINLLEQISQCIKIRLKGLFNQKNK